MSDVRISIDPELSLCEDESGLSEPEFTCHCCYEVLVDPSTLTCGHSFCRHCLALWWASSRRTECPECRERWQSFPKVNILLRDAVEKLFAADVSRRREAVQRDPRVSQVLQMLQQYEQEHTRRKVTPQHPRQLRQIIGDFYSGVLTTLACMCVVLLVYRWFTADSEHDVLVRKPISSWSTDDVILWVERLGDWTNQYKETFRREQINGRLLTLLRDEDLSGSQFSIQNPSHRQAVMTELQRIKELRVKLPQNLWEYKAVNFGKSLFLLMALQDSPRLALLYLYLFDYEDTFLPFIHTCCPAHTASTETDHSHSNSLEAPGRRQWAEFLVKYCLLPHQLVADFAWDWLTVHYWTARIVILNATLLSVLEITFIWSLCRRGEIKTLPEKMWHHLIWMLKAWLVNVLLWPLIPYFICNCLFYMNLYFNPINNIQQVIKTVLRTELGV